MQLVIDSHGTGRCVYDELVDVRRLGSATIQRASHVEPTVGGEAGGSSACRWTCFGAICNSE